MLQQRLGGRRQQRRHARPVPPLLNAAAAAGGSAAVHLGDSDRHRLEPPHHFRRVRPAAQSRMGSGSRTMRQSGERYEIVLQQDRSDGGELQTAQHRHKNPKRTRLSH